MYLHWILTIKYLVSTRPLCWALSWQLKTLFFPLFLLLKAWHFQDNTVHSKNCGEILKINGSVTIFRRCYFLLSLMLRQFGEDLAVYVFLWDICNQPPCKLFQKQTESCSWVSARLNRENIQFSHFLVCHKKGQNIIRWPKKTSITHCNMWGCGVLVKCFLGFFCYYWFLS